MFLIQNDKTACTWAVQMHTSNPQLLESKSGICQYGQPTMLLSSSLYSSLFAFRILEHKIISYRFWVLWIKDRTESAQEKVIQGCLKERNWKASFIFSGQERNGPREDGDQRTRLCGRKNKMLQNSPMSYLLSQNASFNLSWDKKMFKTQLLIYLVLFNPYGMFNSGRWEILSP